MAKDVTIPGVGFDPTTATPQGDVSTTKVSKKEPTQVTDAQWQELAKATGISVPQLHQFVSVLVGAHAASNPEEGFQEILSKAPKEESQTQLREGAEKRFDYTAQEWAALSPADKAQAISAQEKQQGVGVAADPSKKKGTAKAGPKTAPVTNPWVALSNALAGEYASQVQGMQQYLNPSSLAALTNQTNQGAESLLAGTPAASESGWLNSMNQQAQAFTQPLTQALGQYGSAQGKAAQGVGQAIGQMGQAETAQIESAPYQTLLSTLASEIPYELSKQAVPTPQSFGQLPPWLTAVLGKWGITGPAAGGTSLPGVTPTTANKSTPAGTSSGSGTSSTGGG